MEDLHIRDMSRGAYIYERRILKIVCVVRKSVEYCRQAIDQSRFTAILTYPKARTSLNWLVPLVSRPIAFVGVERESI